MLIQFLITKCIHQKTIITAWFLARSVTWPRIKLSFMPFIFRYSEFMRKLNIDKLTWVWQIGALETSSAQVLYYFLSTPNHFFFFLRYLGLNSGPTPQATPPAQFFVIGFFKIGSCKLFAWAGFKLRSSWSLSPE
jgi:hypothetical protein